MSPTTLIPASRNPRPTRAATAAYYARITAEAADRLELAALRLWNNVDADWTARDWYARESLAIATDLPDFEPARLWGAIAALSPATSWAALRRLFPAWAASGGTTSMPAYGRNVAAARRIMGWDLPLGQPPPRPLEILKGPKVRAFYCALANAGRTSEVCVDRHACNLALGRPIGSKAPPMGPGLYRAIAEAYRLAAGRAPGSLAPAELQAVLWVNADRMGWSGRADFRRGPA